MPREDWSESACEVSGMFNALGDVPAKIRGESPKLSLVRRVVILGSVPPVGLPSSLESKVSGNLSMAVRTKSTFHFDGMHQNGLTATICLQSAVVTEA
mmetsp:Transcript_50995/g.119239  ORF Transcript_50995/g.119239 Transcript_50995/m.119239 type:complete len:98 (-) Transcript_50995:34-327(-)